MNDFIKKIREGVVFDSKTDFDNNTIIDELQFISWDQSYSHLESISDSFDPFEFGVTYNLGVRTIMKGISELWTVRGTLEPKDQIDNYTATIGWNETGHNKFENYRKFLIENLGKPKIDNNSQLKYEEAIVTWGPYSEWEFDTVKLVLWGSDFRGSMWYKIDIKNGVHNTS
jgi:hypothetical protein